jgi:hypothetical protein
MSNVEVFHDDCVACLAAMIPDPVVATLVLLKMLQDGHSLDQTIGDLCIPHARRIGPIELKVVL